MDPQQVRPQTLRPCFCAKACDRMPGAGLANLTADVEVLDELLVAALVLAPQIV